MHPWTRCFAVFPDDDELRSSNEGRGSGGGGGGGGQGPDEEQRSGSDIVMVDMTEVRKGGREKGRKRVGEGGLSLRAA